MTDFTALAGWTRFQGPSPISRLRRIGEPSELHSGVGSCWSLASGRGEGARLSVRFGGAVTITRESAELHPLYVHVYDVRILIQSAENTVTLTFITRNCFDKQISPEKLKSCVQI